MPEPRAGEAGPDKPLCLLTGGHVYAGVHRTRLDDGTTKVESHCARCDRQFVNIEKPRRSRRG